MADSNNNQAQKLDLERDRKFLTQAQIDYMRAAQVYNADRVRKLQRIRRNNLLTAGLLGTAVVSIYAYSMWSLGGEKFLDEDEKQ